MPVSYIFWSICIIDLSSTILKKMFAYLNFFCVFCIEEQIVGSWHNTIKHNKLIEYCIIHTSGNDQNQHSNHT